MPQYASTNFSDNPSGNQLYPRDPVNVPNHSKKQMMKTGQNFNVNMQGNVNRSLNMNYQRGGDQQNVNQSSGGNIHYQNAEYLQQSYPQSNQ